PTLRTSHLFTLSLTVDPNMTDVGETPYGRRRIGTVTGGTFEGEELRGTVLPSPGGDWLVLPPPRHLAARCPYPPQARRRSSHLHELPRHAARPGLGDRAAQQGREGRSQP